MIISVTGHRPDKLGGYSKEATESLNRFAIRTLQQVKPTKVLTGMALGWDTSIALACVALKIPFVACIPFAGQDALWAPNARGVYKELLTLAESVVNVSGERGYKVHYMQERNIYMVENSEVLLALYNKDKTGGTASAVRYAEAVGKKVINAYPEWTAFRFGRS